MNDADRDFLLAVSGLLHYPGDDFFMQTRSVEELCDLLPVVRACPLPHLFRHERHVGASVRTLAPAYFISQSALIFLLLFSGFMPGLAQK